MYVIGDVHGCFDTLKALVKKIPENEKLVFVGDLIDRGPKSSEVVDFVKDLVEAGKAFSVMGNHELMAIDWDKAKRPIMSGWLSNGGRSCLDSYKDEAYKFDEAKFKEHLEWFKTLPIYLEFDEKDEDGRSLVVSHSNVCNVWKIKDDPEKRSIFNREVLWGRPHKLKHHPKDIYNIIGHTPQPSARIRSFYANIDSGCYATEEYEDYGKLTAIHWPSKEIIEQECIDDVSWG